MLLIDASHKCIPNSLPRYRAALASKPFDLRSTTPQTQHIIMNTLDKLATLTAQADSALIAVRSARCVDGHGETLPDISTNTIAALTSLVEAGRIAAGVLHGLPGDLSTIVDKSNVTDSVTSSTTHRPTDGLCTMVHKDRPTCATDVPQGLPENLCTIVHTERRTRATYAIPRLCGGMSTMVDKWRPNRAGDVIHGLPPEKSTMVDSARAPRPVEVYQ